MDGLSLSLGAKSRLHLFAAPAFAGSAAINADLPAWQDHETIATGRKDLDSSRYATVDLWSDSPHGGTLWIDRGLNNQQTDAVTVYPGDTKDLYYYSPSNWSDSVQLRGHQIGFGPNAADRVYGVVNFR